MCGLGVALALRMDRQADRQVDARTYSGLWKWERVPQESPPQICLRYSPRSPRLPFFDMKRSGVSKPPGPPRLMQNPLPL